MTKERKYKVVHLVNKGEEGESYEKDIISIELSPNDLERLEFAFFDLRENGEDCVNNEIGREFEQFCHDTLIAWKVERRVRRE